MEKTCKVAQDGTPILTALIRLSKMPAYCLGGAPTDPPAVLSNSIDPITPYD